MKNLLDQNFEGQKVLVRVDFNVPLDEDFNITDDSRIKAALPTLNKLIQDKAKVILMSHLGRPKGVESKFSLSHIVDYLQSVLEVNVSFSENCIGEKTMSSVKNLKNGEVLLLENLRFHKEEKSGDSNFAKQLAGLADVYVNDAFGTAHRDHASTSIIAQFFPKEKYFGLLLKNEIENLEKALNSPKKPFTVIIGGSKISGKIDVITSLLDKIDNLIIGGGMSYTFIKESWSFKDSDFFNLAILISYSFVYCFPTLFSTFIISLTISSTWSMFLKSLPFQSLTIISLSEFFKIFVTASTSSRGIVILLNPSSQESAVFSTMLLSFLMLCPLSLILLALGEAREYHRNSYIPTWVVELMFLDPLD